MSKNVNLPFEVMEKAVTRVLAGESRAQVADDLNVSKNTIGDWVLRANAQGIESIKSINYKNRLTTSEKIRLIEEFKKSSESMHSFAINHGLRTTTTLRRWLKNYDNGILLENKGEISHMGKKKTSRSFTLDERITVVDWLLANNNNYLAASVKFNASYQQVYGWFKKFQSQGYEGLEDRRGCTSNSNRLSELDQLKIENKELKKKLDERQLSDELLKKYREIERRHRS